MHRNYLDEGKQMGSFEITKIKAREILDSQGRPMVEVDVVTKEGILGRAGAPCGISVGKYEASVLRDNDERYNGLGVTRAVRNINEIVASTLIGKDVTAQREIDELLINLDGTENKSKLGVNAILSLSFAVAEAAAAALHLPVYRYIGGTNSHTLPVPMFNVVNGGPYSASDLDFQEHMIMPLKAASFSEALRMSVEVYYELGTILRKKYGKKGIVRGHAAGYAPPIANSTEVFDRILDSVDEAGYAGKFVLCLDSAASHIYNVQKKKFTFSGREVTRDDLFDFYSDLKSAYPIFSIEDPLDEDDFEGHAELTRKLGIQIVGDDLFATNIQRLKKGISIHAGNALILKPNQIGTLTETFDVARLAIANSYEVIPSMRAGKPEDPIADIAVALNCSQVKFGAPTTAERTWKYNQLLRIEEELGSSAEYAGKALFAKY